MSEAIVAKRYADALFQLGNEKGTLEKLTNDFSVAKEIFENNGQINKYFKHPGVAHEKKNKILEESFDGVHQDVLNALKLLVERGRIEMVPSIVDHFIQLVNDKRGIAEAKVYSVRELTKVEQEELKKTFAKRFNKKDIHLINIVDPDLLGGIRVQVGNTIFDGSVKNKLKRIERDIVAANN